MALEAFKPATGPLTQLVIATTTASTAISLSSGAYGVRIQPSAAVWFTFGTSAGSSSGLAAVLPTTGVAGAAAGIPMIGNSVEVFNVGPNAYFSFITSTSGATSNVYLTPGDGV